MKDHELRELINAVTVAASTYSGTQQLREQISHLIVPIFKKTTDGPDFFDGHDCEGFVVAANAWDVQVDRNALSCNPAKLQYQKDGNKFRLRPPTKWRLLQ